MAISIYGLPQRSFASAQDEEKKQSPPVSLSAG